MRAWPFHPFAIAAAFVLGIALPNSVRPAGFIRPLLVAEAVAALALAVGWIWFRDRDRSGLFATAVALGILSRSPIEQLVVYLRDTEGIPITIVVLGALTTIVVTGLIVLLRSLMRGRLTPYFSRASAFLNVLALVLVAAVVLPYVPDIPRWFTGTSGSQTVAPGGRPDIYFILLDGYPRPDELWARFDIDDSAYVSALQQQGFDVDQRSQSNYPATELTLASMFQMDYVQLDASGSLSGTISKGALKTLLEDSVNDGQAFVALRNAGYEIDTVPPGWEDVSLRTGVDRYLDGSQLTDFEAVLMQQTWLDPSLVQPAFLFHPTHDRVVANLDQAAAMAREPGQKPRFAFIHVPAPHLPFAFGTDGATPQYALYSAHTGRDSVDLTDAQFRDGYEANLRFLNQRVVEAVREIIRASSQPPVVIVFSDHGYNGDSPLPPATMLHNFLAVHVPGLDSFPAGMPTPVNLFRTILASYGLMNSSGMRPNRFFSADLRGTEYSVTEIANPH